MNSETLKEKLCAELHRRIESGEAAPADLKTALEFVKQFPPGETFDPTELSPALQRYAKQKGIVGNA